MPKLGSNGDLRVSLAVVSILAMIVVGLIWYQLDGLGEVRAETGRQAQIIAGHDVRIENLQATQAEIKRDLLWLRNGQERIMRRLGVDPPPSPRENE